MSAEVKPYYITDSKGMVVFEIKYDKFDDCYTLKKGIWIDEKYPLLSDAIARSESLGFKLKVFGTNYGYGLFILSVLTACILFNLFIFHY